MEMCQNQEAKLVKLHSTRSLYIEIMNNWIKHDSLVLA